MNDIGEWGAETPLTASIDPRNNLSTIKVLFTKRFEWYIGCEGTSTIPPEFPWTVGLSPTSRCSRQCYFCSHTRRNELGHFLSQDIMAEIHRDLRLLGVKGVIYAGGGDPFDWEHNLIPFIEEASSFCSVGIDTNGVLANRILQSQVALKIFYITFALLGHNRELYREVCGRDQFSIVDENIRRFTALKRKNQCRYPHINVKLSVNRRSYSYLAEMWKYARTLGTDNVFARCMNNFELAQNVELTPAQKQELYNIAVTKLGLPSLYAHTFAQNLVFPGKPPNDIELPTRCWSVVLGHNLGVKQDGECFLCVPTAGLSQYSIGNVNRRSIRELWGSDRHLEVIKHLDTRMQSGECDITKCRHFRLNLVIEGALKGRYQCPDKSLFMENHAPFL
ncbi:MAG: radical SAM/SPASM domain-containing protein [Patescibacteria group bacterium]|nr:radical SAM/SPASM domain-containing protein [Patescibacteria group bacterium]